MFSLRKRRYFNFVELNALNWSELICKYDCLEVVLTSFKKVVRKFTEALYILSVLFANCCSCFEMQKSVSTKKIDKSVKIVDKTAIVHTYKIKRQLVQFMQMHYTCLCCEISGECLRQVYYNLS